MSRANGQWAARLVRAAAQQRTLVSWITSVTAHAALIGPPLGLHLWPSRADLPGPPFLPAVTGPTWDDRSNGPDPNQPAPDPESASEATTEVSLEVAPTAETPEVQAAEGASHPAEAVRGGLENVATREATAAGSATQAAPGSSARAGAKPVPASGSNRRRGARRAAAGGTGPKIARLSNLFAGGSDAADGILFGGEGADGTGGGNASELETPPRLGGYVTWDCPWPTTGTASASDHAVVHIAVDVSADGRPIAAYLIDDDGRGFGPDAIECAMRHRYIPGRDASGHPKGGRTAPFGVRFNRTRK